MGLLREKGTKVDTTLQEVVGHQLGNTKTTNAKKVPSLDVSHNLHY